jgi:protein N-terminal asparagine amidohydrolase
LQGEIAHSTPAQADILVSDDATTCHIVALWSRYVAEGDTTGEAISSRVLATMAHIDGVGYEASLRDAVNEHIKYHSSHPPNQTVESNIIEECKESCTSGVIEMSIHIMGGFNDEEGSSIEITDNLLRTFAALSNQCLDYSVSKGLPRVRMTLETCAVASANDDGTGCPLGRGLAIEVATGNIFLAEVEDVVDESLPTPSAVAAVASRIKFPGVGKSKSNANAGCGASAEGPEVTLRSMRLWASSFHSQGREKKHLNVIFRPDSDCLCIEPFFFSPHSTAKRLLDCSDDQLLQITSTSPEVEKDNFVRKVREALTYMNSTKSSSVFGVDQPMPIAYRRVGLNGWVRII